VSGTVGKVVSGLAASVSLAALVACGDADPQSPQRRRIEQARRQELYDRADRAFAAAYLWRPSSETSDAERLDAAPLLMQETGGARGEREPDPFGALEWDERGASRVVAAPPTVYFLDSTVEIGDRSYGQRTYRWWYPAPSGTTAPATQGIRVTSGQDEFPAVYEVLSDSSGARLIFVATAVEQAAAEEYGPPLPGRRFAIERAVEDAPDVIVAGVLESGPTPLGPFVYLSKQTRDVGTLICRCMPSQVDVVLDSTEYRLISLSAEELPGWPTPSWLRPDEAGSLQSVLRLPSRGL
jgi:hypothetical protein